jgi:hypothetical protein
MEFLVSMLGEFAKSFAGEAGTATARALFKQKDTEEDGRAAENEINDDPLWQARYVAESFLEALAAADHDTAWAWCDPNWPYDPKRSPSYHETFSYAPPISWSVRQQHVPPDWVEGTWLEWVATEMVITFDNGDGTFTGHPAIVVTIVQDEEWRIAGVLWNPHGLAAEEPSPQGWVFQCERCPEHFEVAAGQGRVWAKCPSCWTPQEVDT